MPDETPRIITLLTDFGLQDPFVGVMKGVALSVNPDARLVDLTHGIRAQDVLQAGYVLASSYRYFPRGSIHVFVVDPGVGGERRIIAAEIDGHIFLGPDNGLLTLLLQDVPMTQAVWVTREELFRQPVSATFHGRDIMAPVAAFLSMGNGLADIGEPVDDVMRIDISAPACRPRRDLQGEVICEDRFGNLITNVRLEDLQAMAGDGDYHACQVRVGERVINGIRRTYSDVAPGKALALIGSIGRLEIAVHMGSAAEITGGGAATKVCITMPGVVER